MKEKYRTLVLSLATISLISALSSAANLPAGFTETRAVDGVDAGTTMAFAPDGRLFVCKQNGELYVAENGVLPEEPLLSVDADSQGEHGLVGITFDPDFEANGYLYLDYTASSPLVHQRVSRFKISGDGVGEEEILLDMEPAGRSIYHVGGNLAFGPDRKLYVGIGDNGGLPKNENSQQFETHFGKILRINPDGSVPKDNPLKGDGVRAKTYSYGFRNPYSFDFDPISGRLFVNDVGGTLWEEINDVVAGGNYGWPKFEGSSDAPDMKTPLFSYAHGPVTSETEGCGIVGGVFYSGSNFPAQYRGKYFFTDYCNNWLRVLDPATGEVQNFGTKLKPNPTALRVGPDGALYYMSRWEEGIFKIQYQTN